MAAITVGEGGLEKVTIKTEEGDSAEVYLHGGHLTSWKTAAGDELLFVSKEAIYKPPKAIRGGVPVCFPQFADMGPINQHGFARNSTFAVEASTPDSVTLVFKPSEAHLEIYPHPFELRIEVSIAPRTLSQKMTVKNLGSSDMAFTCALHTYYRVGNINQAKVYIPTGQGNLEHLDSTDGRARKQSDSNCVDFTEEVDRIYLKTSDAIKIVDGANGRGIGLEKSGFPDAVVWNPWIEKAKATGDLGDEEYKEMLCVEPAVAASGPIVLPAGETWCGTQELTLAGGKNPHVKQ
ncbi:hypothetical protein BSKO_09489 [Bryopsis sp. KO-2023]|nr:hypothetical protein BSKO_09489 [Bryopsis sp. KO-2023]